VGESIQGRRGGGGGQAGVRRGKGGGGEPLAKAQAQAPAGTTLHMLTQAVGGWWYACHPRSATESVAVRHTCPREMR
jgi:hypothetical protein